MKKLVILFFNIVLIISSTQAYGFMGLFDKKQNLRIPAETLSEDDKIGFVDRGSKVILIH